MLDTPLAYIAALLAAIALVFIILWWSSKPRSYLLWWALAHGALSVLISSAVSAEPLPNLLFNACHWLASIGFVAAASQFRQLPISDKAFVSFAIIAVAVTAVLELITGRIVAEYIAGVGTVVAFAFTAWALWEPRLIARITAILFALRAVNSMAFTAANDYPSFWMQTHIVSFILVLAVAITALFLVLNIVQKSQLSLQAHIRFLSLTQEISETLQDVNSVFEASDRVVSILLEHKLWANAAIFVPDNCGLTLTLVAGAGKDFRPSLRDTLIKGVPMVGTFIGKAYRSQLPLSSDKLAGCDNSARFGELATVLNRTSQAAIPINHNNKMFGVLVVNRVGSGSINDAEKNTLAHIGQVIGCAFANLENLAELTHNASHDALTDLPNRVALHTFFNHQPAGKRLALMLFDLNQFKYINDSFGHSVGDDLLCALATRFRAGLTDQAIQVYRLGGDEFVVTYDMDLLDMPLACLAANLGELIARPIQLGDQCFTPSAAIGVVDNGGLSLECNALLRQADIAMYYAKKRMMPVAFYNDIATPQHGASSSLLAPL